MAWKAFDHGLVCRGKQYAENTVFEEEKADICKNGMHYCDNPMDLMMYHELVDSDCNIMDVAQVEDLAPEATQTQKDGNSVKSCTTKLKVGAKVKFRDWVEASVKAEFERCKTEESGNSARLASSGNYAQLASSGDSAQLASSGNSARLASSGNYAQLASSGDSAQLASSGNYAQLASSGNYAQLASSGNSARLASSGDFARLASSGDFARLASSGNSAQLASSGNFAQLASSGNFARLASSGNYAQLASSGNSAQLASSGEDSIAAGIGIDNIAKAALGSWIVLAEWKYNKEKGRYVPVCVKSAKVDGEIIKPDTFYKLENGEFVEVK